MAGALDGVLLTYKFKCPAYAIPTHQVHYLLTLYHSAVVQTITIETFVLHFNFLLPFFVYRVHRYADSTSKSKNLFFWGGGERGEVDLPLFCKRCDKLWAIMTYNSWVYSVTFSLEKVACFITFATLFTAWRKKNIVKFPSVLGLLTLSGFPDEIASLQVTLWKLMTANSVKSIYFIYMHFPYNTVCW